MSSYDAERYDINGRWFKYRTEVFYRIHTKVYTFKHRTAIGGTLGTLIIVKLHKLLNPDKKISK